MKMRCFWAVSLFAVSMFAPFDAATAELTKGSPAPPLAGVDITGTQVTLDTLVQAGPYVVILYFFTPDTGGELAAKLQQLQTVHGKDKFQIVAVGMREDEAALVDFSKRMGISYHLLEPGKVENAAWLSEVNTLPMTIFVRASEEKIIDQVLSGGGATTAKLLSTLAENLFRQRRTEALQMANDAVAAAPTAETRELRGFVLAAEGKLDEAEKEFGEIGSKTGLAKVALERGDAAGATALASEAGGGYAGVVKAEALARQGKLDEAGKAAAAVSASDAASDWQKSDAANLEGRIAHEQGRPADAAAKYGQAVALDPYNVVALSNEGAALRDSGNLEGAKKALEKAAGTGAPDPASALLLQQVMAELKEANDTQKAELVRSQIESLGKRFKELKESGASAATDAWTTRPLVMALLPGGSGSPVFFERAGTDVLVQREVEAGLGASGKVGVVERAMLDKLLQELNLGSSELATAETQRSLGQVLSAGMLGFVEYGRIGPEIAAHLRLVNTETTAIEFQTKAVIDENNPADAAKALTEAVLGHFSANRELKGLIADASSEEAVVINLGAKHGVRPGMQFIVLADGAPIEVGGRVIAHRQEPKGVLEITSVEAEYGVARVKERRDGAVIEKGMKLKASVGASAQ